MAETVIRLIHELIPVQKDVAEQSQYEIVWLKGLAEDLAGDGGASPNVPKSMLVPKLSMDLIDQLLISRLELDPQGMRWVTYAQTTEFI